MRNEATTATYRNYAFEDLADGKFAIDTSGTEFAVIRAAANHPEFAFDVEIDRIMARDIGTALISWTGEHAFALSAYDDWKCIAGALEIDVVDGQADITCARDGEIAGYAPTSEQAHDLGRRLIVWAGVADAGKQPSVTLLNTGQKVTVHNQIDAEPGTITGWLARVEWPNGAIEIADVNDCTPADA